MTTSIAYKVLTADQWEELKAGQFRGAPVDQADGYIHLSTAEQLTETVDRHFAGQTKLVVAAIDLGTLGDAVRWEPSRHGQLFPRIYAQLTLGHVTAWAPLKRDPNGTVALPA